MVGYVYDSSARMMTIIASVIKFDISLIGHNENSFPMKAVAFGKFSHCPLRLNENSIETGVQETW